MRKTLVLALICVALFAVVVLEPGRGTSTAPTASSGGLASAPGFAAAPRAHVGATIKPPSGRLPLVTVEGLNFWGPPPPEPPPPPVEVAPPVRLRIPRLNVDAPIEYAGLDKDGVMAVPYHYDNVAWYAGGPRPGQPGNAVIAGHRDSPTAPAIFYKLNDLQAGDRLIVDTATGGQLLFEVTARATYRADQIPLNDIFGFSFERNLNLITCGGKFDRTRQAYQDRVVVYTHVVR